MASGPYWNPKRGTYSVQWKDGTRWKRTTITKKRPGWKPGDPAPKKIPPEAVAALADYQRRENANRDKRNDPRQTVREFLDAFAATYHLSRKANSLRLLQNAIKTFLDWCDANGITRLEEITSATCHRWITDRAMTISPATGRKIGYATLKCERGLIATAWSEAYQREEISKNPWVSVKVPGKPPDKVRGSWSREELNRLLAVSKPWLRDLLIVGCNTGLRIKALSGLKWSDIHWNESDEEGGGYGVIVVPRDLDKIDRGYRVPISRECHDVLFRRKIHRAAHASRVLTGHGGQPILRAASTDAAIRKACRRAGLATPDSPNHHMRRTFGRWAVKGQLTGRPIPVYVVSRWMGHTSIATTEHYLNITHEDSQQWIAEADQPLRSGHADRGHDPVET
jgi:integrase